MTTEKKKQITIIGAGLVGSLQSIYLAKRGYEVTLYEKRPDMRKHRLSSGRSINLALAERGIYPLKEVDLMDAVERLLTPMRGRMLHSETGELTFRPYGQQAQEVIYSISRSDLNKLLMTAAEEYANVQFIFNVHYKDIDFDRKIVHLYDAVKKMDIRVRFEILIASDGAGSQVRKAMQRAVEGDESETILGHSYKELRIPAAPKEIFQMEKEALHIWPRENYMLIALPNLDGSYTATLFLANEGTPSFAMLQTEDQVAAFFEINFPDVLALIPDLSQQFFNNPTSSLGTMRCWSWSYKQVLLIGDAAHAIVPFHGQGMNCGFEDCSVLNAYLDEYDDAWDRLYEPFERERKINTDAIADMALENYTIMRNSVKNPKFQLKQDLEFKLETSYPEIFIPRYSMVMFHRIPYAKAKKRGEIQTKILDQLLENIQTLDQVDMKKADELITRNLCQDRAIF